MAKSTVYQCLDQELSSATITIADPFLGKSYISFDMGKTNMMKLKFDELRQSTDPQFADDVMMYKYETVVLFYTETAIYIPKDFLAEAPIAQGIVTYFYKSDNLMGNGGSQISKTYRCIRR